MLLKALVKEVKSGLTLSRQNDDTKQSAPHRGNVPWDNGQDWCTLIGSTSDTTERRRSAFFVQADELERIKGYIRHAMIIYKRGDYMRKLCKRSL